MKSILSSFFMMTLAGSAFAQGHLPTGPFFPDPFNPLPQPVVDPKIQVAIVLDTSGSMSGLIEQTKRQVWKLVNNLSGYQQAGRKPVLEIGLIAYGSGTIPLAKGAMATLKPLSTQLDQVSKELFPLQATGSEEFVPMALTKALLEFDWSANPNDVRAVFVAGNETIHQGPIKEDSLSAVTALTKIEVSTIYAGNVSDAVFEEWQNLAAKLGGSSGNIDQSLQIPTTPSPFDADLAKLNTAINATIIPFGHGGFASWQSYLETDHLYNSTGGAFFDMINAKTSGFYDVSSWDLVTAVKDKGLNLANVDLKTLPVEFQNMTLDELMAVIEEKYEARKELELTIADLAKQREEYLAPLIEAAIGKTESLVQETLIKALARQLESKGFTKS